MTPSTSSSSLPPLSEDFFSSSADSPAAASIAGPTITWSNSPITPSSSSSISAPSLHAAKRSKWEKMDNLLSSYGFLSLGDFLDVLFHNHARDEPEPRTPRHITAVNKFFSGSNTFQISHLIERLYHHRESRPKRRHTAEHASAFSPHIPLEDIHFAQPSLSAWATRLVGNRIHHSVGTLARKNRDDSESRTHIRASTNGKDPNARVVSWEDIEGLAQKYATNAELVWYLTECMAAPRKKGVVVIRRRRPHPAIQVAAISSFILSRNQYTSGDLALPLGIWHFARKSHIDVKHVYCRFGSIISDTTVRTSLNTMTEHLLSLLINVRKATEEDESRWFKIIDNVQEYSPVYEHGLGRDNQLKVGTACTAVCYEDCKPGAFNADDHVARVIAQERQTMTAESIFSSIDWTHNQAVACLHFVRVLAEFVPELAPLRAQITTRFCTAPIAKHLLPEDRKTINQPIGTNAEHELELKGMRAALSDFDQQLGVEPEKSDNILSWVRGDGASHATIMRLKKYLVTSENIYHSFRNVISTPETWHTKATDLNSCASNHFGPAALKDPSSLSRSSNAANMKRPTDLKKCDFYPTSRSMTLIWEARVLDCWRLILNIETDILAHFSTLATAKKLPTLDDLVAKADTIRQRYASQTAYDQSLSKSEYDKADPGSQVPSGTPWNSRSTADATPESATDNMPGLSKEGPKIHREAFEFDGDRVLSNTILFLMEFGWWIELNYAIPGGDVGRIIEIFKIFIFTFGGTANQNYMRYMLDLYALLEFECSPDLKEALLNNWLMRLLRTWLEGNLMQEHNNRWLEDMIRRRGGNFDDKFYRQTLSPNVRNFIRLKEDIESAFELKRRGKAHTSPHLRNETKVLLRLYKEEELHLFRSTRSMGHAAVNRFDRGYRRLEGGKLDEYLAQSAEYANLLADMERVRRGTNSPSPTVPDSDSDSGSSHDGRNSRSSMDLEARPTSPLSSNSDSSSSSASMESEEEDEEEPVVSELDTEDESDNE
ncbi:hypothetical protein DFH08DRAFT_712721 [Mycena albidolilacea]|uniref:DUF6589 domain-containing protein n=1 Tax=Mycena albidolilacea TaxID=1033008 RepID=A0AAD7EHJ2_9AGAR|nr:hypothetical protein DFH08DRAFT_712721 [Mycena albidolilacea]